MLGERIKKLRKQKKLTLEALAGKELSKGMLSLIENNKANPSMESLTYIAKQLDVDVADLLDTVSSEELRGILEKAEKIYNDADEKTPDKYKQLIELVEPLWEVIPQGYEAARLLEIYGYSLWEEKEANWLEVSKSAANMFEQLNISSNRAAIAIFWVNQKFLEHKYDESLTIFLQERKTIETTFAYIDPLTRLDLDYHEAILHFAVGHSQSAIRIMENAIQFSREKKVFYRIDDLYRLAACEGMLSKDEKKKAFYLEKLKQYGEFADNKYSIYFYKLLHIMARISEKKEYEKAIEEIDQLLSDSDTLVFYDPWFTLEKGKACYYLGRYEEALRLLDKVEIPDVHHPFDLSIFYVMDTYKALCHRKVGDKQTAVQSIEQAYANFNLLPSTPFKEFTMEVYEEIKS
ncbi:helix-turn-helix transcriptional regulator [Alkalihalobacillus sp. MEB130]|uniref:helix-turn-helix transcriptional regulator n=1 Tax=Alkalihalobacillus sp. MEB130 TaxID=2976704 RepID=UPI0028DD55B0|nr:helix-turn-helix transcriptional regulator [Alkalihalobacillus sp. MEB130]MDT8860813.1 helix-turn-helix transcriptional regulator [Alkalihalobacillus sp. MEB130]